MRDIEINQQLTLQDYRRFRLDIAFKSIFIKILYGVLTLIGLISLLGLIFDPDHETGDWSSTITLFILIAIYPAFVIYQTHTSFQSHKTLHENIRYTFSTANLQISGESFVSNLDWNSFFKVQETRKHILLYQSKNIAVVLLKKNIARNDLVSIREIMNQVEGPKVKMRKD